MRYHCDILQIILSNNERSGVPDKQMQPVSSHNIKRYASCVEILQLLIKFGIELIAVGLRVT